MTEGKASHILWAFSIPMLISSIFQQLYNIADSIIVGNYVGEDALACVGASYPITMIFMAIALGSNIGCSVIISRYFGAKEYTLMKSAIKTSFLASFIISILLTILGLLSCPLLMHILQTPANIFEDGLLYLRIYIGGFAFLFLYNICTGIFNSLGDSKTPLYLLIGSSIGNVILDWCFVVIFHMGVAGVAWATFLAQGVSCILAFFTLRKRIANIPSDNQPIPFSSEMLIKISKVAIPSILQQSFISIGNLFIQGLINSMGSAVIAGYSAAIKLNTFALTSFTTLANGVSSFTSQNIGAGKIERVKKGFHSGVTMVLFIAAIFFVVYFFFDDTMIHIFIKSGSEEATQVGALFLKIVSPFYFVICIKLIADGVLRGASAMTYFMIATFTDLLLRVILAFILAKPFSATGIWMSWPIGWTTACLLSFSFYASGKWKSKNQEKGL